MTEIIRSHESTRQSLIEKAKIIRQHTAAEVAGALGGTDGVTSDVHEFTDQQQSPGSVAISGQAQHEAAEQFAQDGKTYQGMFHTHIESLGHAHAPSDQDKETFKQHKVNEIAYLREDGTIDIKAYNSQGEQIDQTIGGKTAKVITIAADDTIDCLEQAA